MLHGNPLGGCRTGQVTSDDVGRGSRRAGWRRSLERTHRLLERVGLSNSGRQCKLDESDRWVGHLRRVRPDPLRLLDQQRAVRVVVRADGGDVGSFRTRRTLVVVRGQTRAQHPKKGEQAGRDPAP